MRNSLSRFVRLLSVVSALCITAFLALTSTAAITVAAPAAAPASAPFTPARFDLTLTHDGGAPCGMVDYSSPTLADLDGDGQQEIIVGTVRNSPAEGGYPPCLAVVNANGTLRWSRVLPDSANSTAAVGDINSDGKYDIVIGLVPDDPNLSTGGVIAFDRFGNQLWYYQTGAIGNGLPNGVWASPTILDVNNDGRQEVAFGSWDEKMHVVNGAWGTPFGAQPNNPWPAQMLDTIWSSPAVADLSGDGRLDMVFGGDMTANGILCTGNGGMLRAMYQKYGVGPTHTPGFSAQYGCPLSGNNLLNLGLHGFFVDQSLYSSPAIGEFGSRGKLIVIGSGCAFPVGTNCNGNGNGKWVKVWDRAGNPVATLGTDAPVFGSPALADINGDGVLDIVVGTMGTGWIDGTGQGGTLYAWSGVPGFPLLWAVKPKNVGGLRNVRMPSSPVISDLNGDGRPEILIGYAQEMEVFDHNGNQLTDTGGVTLWLGHSTVNNSAAVMDIDRDGTLDIVTAGSYCDTAGNCDNRGHVWVWSASAVSTLSPSAAGRAAQSRFQWPMFRVGRLHHAYVTP